MLINYNKSDILDLDGDRNQEEDFEGGRNDYQAKLLRTALELSIEAEIMTSNMEIDQSKLPHYGL